MSTAFASSRAMTAALGAHLEPGGTRFRLWTTRARAAAVVLVDERGHPAAEHPLTDVGGGEHETFLPGVGAGAAYLFLVGGRLLPDPYARYLPDGVHGPARVVDPTTYAWRYATRRPPIGSGWVIHELHVGTFTPQGTYAAARERAGELVDLGVTALEVMPVSSFAGRRGWGYDGVAHFAPFAGYGTPDELKAFVDGAHGAGLAVLLDVVYNHFGPDGSYLAAYSPEYFTSRHRTPWGDAPDYSEPHMRRYVLDNVRYWLEEFRFDGLRLDAVHTIVDDSPRHLLTEIADTAHAVPGRPLLIAEDERRDPRIVTEHGLDAYWEDSFHHRVHVLFTGEQAGYYGTYQGRVADLAKLIVDDASTHTRRGAPPARAVTTAPRVEQLVYCLQNHDQVGNRALGERFAELAGVEAQQAAATLLLFLPMTPLLFMGEAWAASSPFLYFTDHDAELGAAVSQGRREEFRAFPAFTDPAERARIPDPQADATFERSKLDWTERSRPPHADVQARYKRLLQLRRTDAVLGDLTHVALTAGAVGEVLWARRAGTRGERVCLLCFDGPPRPLASLLSAAGGRWTTQDLVTGRTVDALGAREAVILTSPE